MSRRTVLLSEIGAVALADLLAVAVCLALVPQPFVAVTAVVAVVTWAYKGLYGRRIALSVLDDFPLLSFGVLVGLSCALLFAPWPDGPRLPVLLAASGLLGGVSLGRTLAYGLILRQRTAGRLSRRAVMVGAGAPATSLIQRIEDHPESGLRLVGTVANPQYRRPADGQVLGTPKDLARVVQTWQVSDVVIGYGGMSSAELVEVLRTCDRVNVDIFVVPRFFELHTLRKGDDHIWGLPLVRIKKPAQRAVTWRAKRAFDVAVASAGLLLALPVMLAVALAVRIEMGRDIFFRQTRIGLGGQEFELLKFRSVAPARNPGPGLWTLSEDDLGPVGRFIRRYSLDELPQLLNVLRGDMSLVGPRPERPEYVKQFSAEVPRYVHRHRVPAGLTGLAAVNGLRGDTSIEDRAQFDNWYIDNWSLWLDIKVLVRTLGAVVRGTGR